MKKLLPSILLLFSLLFLLSACSDSASQQRREELRTWMDRDGKVKVLTTIAMINDLVKNVGGEHVDSIVLIKGDLNPHAYQLVKGDDEKLAFAGIIFYNGLGLEHGPSLQHYLETSPKSVGLGNRLRDRYPEIILHYNGQLDPHIWMDISMWSKLVPFIVEALSEKDPAHAEEYRENGEKLVKRMMAVHNEILDEMMQIPQDHRYLVTSHDAFNYFARAYLAEESERGSLDWQKRFAAPEGLAPDSQLSSRDIQIIIDHLGKHNIEVLFPESNLSKDSIRKIVDAGKEKGLKLMIAKEALYGDAMGPQGSDGDTYLKMIKHNADVISRNLKKSKEQTK